MGGRGGLSASAYRAYKQAKTSGAYTGKVADFKIGAGMSFEDFVARYGDYDETTDTTYIVPPYGAAERLKRQGLDGTVYQFFLDENNDYAKPDVVSSEELNRLIDDGAELFYRGMPNSSRTTGVQKLEQVMYADKYYVGEGIYGDGLYFSGDISDAVMYGARRDSKGAIMRAVLKPDAKIADYYEISRAFMKEHPNVYYGDSELSAYARSKGYDALRAGSSYMNVINRGALIIDGHLATADTDESYNYVASDTSGWRL